MTRLMALAAPTGFSLIALALSTTGRAGETLSGRPKVIDGDTLIVSGKAVGLYGIAAPAKSQTCHNAEGRSYDCGRAAARALAVHIADAAIACHAREADKHGRLLGTCRKGKEDLSAWMVEHGHAVAVRGSQPSYVDDERSAWAKRRGLWAGVFEDPTGRTRKAVTRADTVDDVRLKVVAPRRERLPSSRK